MDTRQALVSSIHSLVHRVAEQGGSLENTAALSGMVNSDIDRLIERGIPTVWLVGHFIHTCAERSLFEVIGVALTEAEAVAACREREHFVAPVNVGKFEYASKADWPGVRYPLAEKETA